MNINLDYVNYIKNAYVDKYIVLDDVKDCLYYALSDGKNIRAVIYLTLIEQLTIDLNIADTPRELLNDCSIYAEYLHTASLILDDMPHMDNDTIRRNKPSLHYKFGTAKAQLSAMSLINMAHQLVSDNIIQLYKNHLYMNIDQFVAFQLFWQQYQYRFLGDQGLAGGQLMDLYLMRDTNLEYYLKMITYKTARLFELSFTLPYCLVAIKNKIVQSKFDMFLELGTNFGIWYQLLDDIDDYNPNQLKNSNNNLLNYMDIVEAKELISEYYAKCTELSDKLSINLNDIFKLIKKN